MSEFSESFHLPRGTTEEAIAILKQAMVAGYAFAAGDRWAPLVFSEGARVGSTDGRDRIIAVNRGILHYVYAEDHGLWVDLYTGPRRVGRLQALFESKDPVFDRDVFLDMAIFTAPEADEVERWLDDAHRPDRPDDRDPYLVPSRLRLPRYEWFAYRYELERAEPSPDRIEVHADGTSTTTKAARSNARPRRRS